MAERTEERRNRFTGKVALLTDEEAIIHDQVFVCEALGKWNEMQKNFLQNFLGLILKPSKYFIVIIIQNLV